MLTYPTFSSTPNIIDAIFFPEALSSCQDVPNSISITISHDNRTLIFVTMAQIASIASNHNKNYVSGIKNVTQEYLKTGDGKRLFDEIRTRLTVNVTVKRLEHLSRMKRSPSDRIKEFETRIDAYRTLYKHSTSMLESIDAMLVKLGYPGFSGSKSKLLPSGRREGTYAYQLTAAIKLLPDTSVRSLCFGNFEAVAFQIWNWKYPELTEEYRKRIIASFHALQKKLCEKFPNENVGCPNTTIRMLWHFKEVGFPYDFDMFKVPEGCESWTKNKHAICVKDNWGPVGKNDKNVR